jgi:hypothetical protein
MNGVMEENILENGSLIKWMVDIKLKINNF